MPENDGATVAPTPKPKKKSRIGDIIIVIVLVVAVLGGVYFAAEIKAAIALRAWSKGAARDAMADLAAALEANDLDATRGYFRDGAWTITVENGLIKAVKDKAAMSAPPCDIATICPGGSMDDVSVKYQYDKNRYAAILLVPTVDGSSAEYKIRRDDDGWFVWMLETGSPPG